MIVIMPHEIYKSRNYFFEDSYLIECPEPYSIEGGIVRYKSLSPGSQVIYSCLQSYKIRGLRKRTCGSYGEWVGKIPECIKYG